MRHSLTALAFALPLAAFAQGPATVGAMSGVLDGVEVSYIIAEGVDVATWWQETDEGVEVSLTAYPSDSPMDDANELRLTFTGDAASRNPEMLSGEIALHRNDETLRASDEAIDLSLESLEVSGESLLLIGDVRATLTPGEENESPLAEDGVTLTANIQATIPGAENSPSSSDQ
jgi:hypothetical protein